MKGKIIRFIPSSGTGIIMVHVNGENGKEYQHLQFNKQHYDSSISKHIYKDQEVEVSLKKIGELYLVEHINYDIGKNLYRRATYAGEPPTGVTTSARYRRPEEGSPRRFSREGTINEKRPDNRQSYRKVQHNREYDPRNNTSTRPASHFQKGPHNEYYRSKERQQKPYYPRKQYSSSNSEQQPTQSSAHTKPSSDRKYSPSKRQSSAKYNRSTNNRSTNFNQRMNKHELPNPTSSNNLIPMDANISKTNQNTERRRFSGRNYRNRKRPSSGLQNNQSTVGPTTSNKQALGNNHNVSQRPKPQYKSREYGNRYRNNTNYNRQYPRRYRRDRYRSKKNQYRIWQQKLAIYLHYKRIKQRRQLFLLKTQLLKKRSYRRRTLKNRFL